MELLDEKKRDVDLLTNHWIFDQKSQVIPKKEEKPWFFDHESGNGSAIIDPETGCQKTRLKVDPVLLFHGNSDSNDILSFIRYRRPKKEVQDYVSFLG